MFQYRTAAKRRAVILGIVLAAFFFGKLFYDIYADRGRVIYSAQQNARGLASALNEHALRTFNGAEATLDSLIRDIDAISGSGMPTESRLQPLLASYRHPGSVLATLFVVSPTGNLHAVSTEYPVRPVTVTDREYFRHHLSSDAATLFISKPFQNRLDHEWLITATKRLSNPDGSLRMIVGASIRTKYFSSFYSTLELRHSDRIVLIRRDGAILALEPFSEQALQADLSGSRLFRRELRRSSEAGTFQDDSAPLDGSKRIVSYRSSATYPVIAVISLDQQDRLKRWQARAVKEVAGAGFLAALVAALSLLVRRQLAHLQRANESLYSKQVELQEAKRRSQEIVNSIDGIVWEFDLASLRFTFISERSAAITGFLSEDWLSDPGFWQSRIPPEDRTWAEWLAPGRDTLPGDASFEYRFRKKDGTLIWLRDIVTVDAEAGQPTRLRGVMLDISQEKQAEAALLESEERYRRISNAVTDYIYTVRIEENGELVTHHGAGCLGVTGYTEEEFAANRHLWLSMVAKQDRDLVRQHAADLVRHGNAEAIEHRIIRKDGQLRWVRNTPVLRFDADERLTGYEGLIQDITERRSAEIALRLSEQRFRQLLENIQLVSMILDQEGKITFCNDYLLRLTGWSREEALGRDWFDMFLPPEHAPQVRAMFSVGVSRGETPAHYENPIVTRDGTLRYISWDNTVLHDTDGSVVGIASIGTDMTQHRALEEQLRQSQKMEATGLLAGGIAHDFNNILTVIIGYCSVMQMHMSPDDPNRDSVGHVLAAAERAAGLTRSLLAFSRKQVMNPRQVDLNAIVHQVEHFLCRVIGEDITLNTRLHGEELHVLADSGQIEQILMNLATNARDAMPDGGTLYLSTQPVDLDPGQVGYGWCTRGRYALLSFSDTGTGMDEHTRAKIFEPFFTTKEVGKGTGLGLAMAYGIVMQHNGQIMVESEPGHGTTFKVYLPMVAGALPEPSQEMRRFDAHSGDELILVAEDEPAVREMVQGILSNFGYRVLLACDGAEAVAMFRAHRDQIDLVLLDLIMPKLSGKAAYDKILRLKPGVRAIFTSGYTADVIRSKGELHPGTELVMKPVHPLFLLQKVRELLDR